MEELQNLRSDSELLETKIVAPMLINLMKLTTKLSIATLALLSVFFGSSCGDQVSDLLRGSYIALFTESFFLSLFILVKLFSESCTKCASYYLIFQMVADIVFDIFYVGWGIYITIIYFNENTCNTNMTITDIIALAVVIYFLLALSLMLCCCGAKLCICLSTLVASAKTDVDRSLSHDLIAARHEAV